MKEKKAIFWGSIVMLIVVIAIVGGGDCITKYRELWKDNADFKNYANDFKTISEFLLKEYPEATDKWLGVSIEDVAGRGIYDSDINNLIECPTEVKAALNTICDFGFPSNTAIFEAIRVCDGNVYFCISNGKYALLYTEENEPIWYDNSVEDKAIYVSKIEERWYHICIEESK